MNQPGAANSPMTKACAGLLALAVAMGIGRFAFTPVLPMMLQDGSLSIGAGALLASANYLGYLIGALSAMALHIRAENAIRGALLAIGIATLAMSVPLGFSAWLLLRLIAGVASAWVLISVSAWALETLAAYQRPLLNSIVFAGVGIGITLAGVLCVALIQRGAAASQAWLLLGVASLGATALVWRFFTPAAGQGASSAPAADKSGHWNAQSMRLICSYGLFGFGYIIPATFLPVMARNALQDATLFGWSWPVFGLAAALSTLAIAPLIRRLGNRRLWMACHVIMALGVLLPVLWSHVLAVFAAALCVGGTFMVITLTAMQEAKRIAGRHATVLMAAMTSAFAAGQIAGPLSVTFRLDRDGSFTIALLLAACMLVAGALLLRSAAAQGDAAPHR